VINSALPLVSKTLVQIPFFCSYPAVAGEDPNDFFCTYSPTTGALVQDNDAGLCEGQAALA